TQRTNVVHLLSGQSATGVDFADLNSSPQNVPVATADVYATDEDTPLAVAAGVGVLANDNVVSPFTATLVGGPAHGTVTLNADGGFSYTPTANYNGSDAFTYRSYDNQAVSAIATVTINIAPVPDPPVAASDAYTFTEDKPLTVVAPGILR